MLLVGFLSSYVYVVFVDGVVLSATVVIVDQLLQLPDDDLYFRCISNPPFALPSELSVQFTNMLAVDCDVAVIVGAVS